MQRKCLQSLISWESIQDGECCLIRKYTSVRKETCLSVCIPIVSLMLRYGCIYILVGALTICKWTKESPVLYCWLVLNIRGLPFLADICLYLYSYVLRTWYFRPDVLTPLLCLWDTQYSLLYFLKLCRCSCPVLELYFVVCLLLYFLLVFAAAIIAPCLVSLSCLYFSCTCTLVCYVLGTFVLLYLRLDCNCYTLNFRCTCSALEMYFVLFSVAVLTTFVTYLRVSRRCTHAFIVPVRHWVLVANSFSSFVLCTCSAMKMYFILVRCCTYAFCSYVAYLGLFCRCTYALFV